MWTQTGYLIPGIISTIIFRGENAIVVTVFKCLIF